MKPTEKKAYEFKAAVSYDIMIVEDELMDNATWDVYARKNENGTHTAYMEMFGLCKDTTTLEEAYKLALANLPDFMDVFEDEA